MKCIKCVLIRVHLHMPWNIMHRNAFTAVSSKWSNPTVQQVCKHENWTLWSPQRSGVGYAADTLQKARYSFVLCLIIICSSFFRPGICLFLNLCFLPLLLPCTSYLCLPFKFLLFLLSLPCAVLISSFFQYLFLPFVHVYFFCCSCLSFVFILSVFLLSQSIYPNSSSYFSHSFQVATQCNTMIAYFGITIIIVWSHSAISARLADFNNDDRVRFQNLCLPPYHFKWSALSRR